MGISDDIKRKSTHHTSHHRHTEDIFDDYDFDLPLEPPLAAREEFKHRENLEDDFFGSKKTTHKKNDLKEYYSDYNDEHDEEGEKEDTEIHSQKRKKGIGAGKIFFWVMMLTLAGLLIWQNKSDIVRLVRVKILRQNVAQSPVESNKTDDYYTSEPTTNVNANANTNAALNLNTNTTAQTTATASVDKSAISIEILNGNGVKNSGSALKTTLEAAGFTIAKTANAKNFNYATSIIYYKTGKEAEANAVKDAMTGKDVAMENNDTLAGSYTVVIVLGAK